MGTLWTSRNGVAALLAAGSFFTVPLSAVAADIFYSGRATGVDGQTTVGGSDQDVLIADTAMSCQGLPHDETVAAFSNPAPAQAKAQNIHVHTLGKNGTAAADATMDNYSLNIPGLNISATGIGAHARATCDIGSGTTTASGHSNFGSLIINGQSTTMAINKRIDIPNVGRIVVDE
ncbi:MAG TPA: choice-of-anchor P family protein, partial [Nevskiaceae bacterium]|nr:choice-of-anchor P family protein [Nevskiaceae bacterium]